MTDQFFEGFLSSSIVEFFTFHSPNLAIIRKKGPLRFSDLKIVTEGGIGKSYVVVHLKMSSKIFGKIIG